MPIKPAYAAINIHLCVYNGAVYVTSGAPTPPSTPFIEANRAH
jgi:hypothetical protein